MISSSTPDEFDTDSCFVNIYKMIEKYGDINKFEELDKETKIQVILELSGEIEEYVNTQSFERIQREDFASKEEEFKINWKQEVVADAGIFVAKKKYVLHIISEKREPKDKLFVRGLELIRSDTPEFIRPILEDCTKDILMGVNITKKIKKYEEDISGLNPSQIATNIGVKKLESYTKNMPYHIKGMINYHSLLKELKLEGKYDTIKADEKAKVVYVKPNKWEYEAVTFPGYWPDEFNDAGIYVDYDKMIDKYFRRKLEMLLQPCGKTCYSKALTIEDFF